MSNDGPSDAIWYVFLYLVLAKSVHESRFCVYKAGYEVYYRLVYYQKTKKFYTFKLSHLYLFDILLIFSDLFKIEYDTVFADDKYAVHIFKLYICIPSWMNFFSRWLMDDFQYAVK